MKKLWIITICALLCMLIAVPTLAESANVEEKAKEAYDAIELSSKWSLELVKQMKTTWTIMMNWNGEKDYGFVVKMFMGNDRDGKMLLALMEYMNPGSDITSMLLSPDGVRSTASNFVKKVEYYSADMLLAECARITYSAYDLNERAQTELDHAFQLIKEIQASSPEWPYLNQLKAFYSTGKNVLEFAQKMDGSYSEFCAKVNSFDAEIQAQKNEFLFVF